MTLELISNISTFMRKREAVNTIGGVRAFAKYFIAPLLIVFQCSIETAFAAPVEVVAKLDGSLSVSDKLNFETSNVISTGNAKPIKMVEVSTKSIGVTTESKMPLNLKSAKDSNENNNQTDSPSWEDYIQAILLGLMGLIPVMVAVFMDETPNVKLRGAALLRSPARTPG